MRISDWSSDVCSSDLQQRSARLRQAEPVLIEGTAERAAKAAHRFSPGCVRRRIATRALRNAVRLRRTCCTSPPTARLIPPASLSRPSLIARPPCTGHRSAFPPRRSHPGRTPSPPPPLLPPLPLPH